MCGTTFFSLLLLLGLTQQVTAQQEPSFSSHANLVPVPTLVRNADGNAIYGLQAKDFIIEDDGIPQKVYLSDTAEGEPISLVIAVQRGRRAKREFDRISTLASMLDPILSDQNNEAALLLFDSKLDLARDFTSNSDEIEPALRNLQAGDHGAAILDAVAYSARLLARRSDGRKLVVLLISETRDHGSRFTKFDDVIRLIGENNISVFAVPFSPYISQQLDVARGTNQDEWTPKIDLLEKLAAARQALRKNVPQALTSMTGGEYELFTTRNAFETDLTTFSNHLNSRYQLSFEPNDPKPGLHQIRVEIRDPGKNWNVLYRSSYWAEDHNR
ncbi:MAG TPA: VWA domain-containing protein [Terriglobales bacterium]|jgi:VWFA-related protein|nr:VWA domain-containing protein [Terriglobales bacterium]